MSPKPGTLEFALQVCYYLVITREADDIKGEFYGKYQKNI